ncbi:hypothetical protein [Kribbella pittospori]|uniref:hypothetical protein n=1 Tax=Kribbella pittospori TaxID=722689 RepID=UPI001EDD854C|nr:hypothetical protein [Kribbella pittospori]
MPALTATQVVAGLAGARYKCSNDAAYATCTSGAVSVWVLAGDQRRPPVISLYSAGPADVASGEIDKVLSQALEIAHVSEHAQIAEWFGQQQGKTSAKLTAGDWLVEYSVEVDTEEPGAHLTFTDKLCKSNCQAE